MSGKNVKGEKPLENRKGKKYFCAVVSEGVEIVLINRPSGGLRSNKKLFVQCNQAECQYVDHNQSPCPLRLDLFAEEIEMREERRRKNKMDF